MNQYTVLGKEMKIHGIALFSLLFAACGEKVKPHEATHDEVALEYPNHFDGAWVMSSAWMGHMGVALALSEDRYYYWMYSDVGGDGGFPYTGTFRLEGDILTLDAPTILATGNSASEMPERRLYSKNWRILRDGFSVCLHSISDAQEDHARTLFPDFGFDPMNPFKNQGYMKKPNNPEMATPRKPSD